MVGVFCGMCCIDWLLFFLHRNSISIYRAWVFCSHPNLNSCKAVNAKYITRGMEVKSKFTSYCCFVTNICWTRSFALGYWLFIFSSVFVSDEERKPFQVIDSLNRVCMLLFYPCPYWGQSVFMTVDSFIMSNQLVVESIMVKHMKLLLVLFLPFKSVLPYEVYT